MAHDALHAAHQVLGDSVYSKLKWEAGVHRVQRVPATESAGRVHTSTSTVAVMPEVDDVEVGARATPQRLLSNLMRRTKAVRPFLKAGLI